MCFRGGKNYRTVVRKQTRDGLQIRSGFQLLVQASEAKPPPLPTMKQTNMNELNVLEGKIAKI